MKKQNKLVGFWIDEHKFYPELTNPRAFPANDVYINYRSIGDSITSFLEESTKFNNSISINIDNCDLSGYPKPKNVVFINQKKINSDFLKMLRRS